ncbi:unnamed protein product [Cunninghamella blakesleeana]
MEHEIDILKSVRHPNVIAFHDAWCTKNEFVFVTELMTSGTLREYIKKLNLPKLKIVKRWCRQILKGLAYLHNYNPPIIHRDIKCENIFINGAHGEVKIGDMGTAEMKMGKKYTIIGTPEFMAPEMYEEMGYNEKVDIYAFGMCLLEMVTGEYPYGECKNPAQIYRKVSSGVKPACLEHIQDEEVLSVIENCIGPEEERMTAQEILEHSFLAVEPDVVLLAADPAHVHLTLQVVFKGMDKLSVKFDYNIDTDTAEEVVREMIEEQVLPVRYQYHITKEINRILRDMEKPNESEQVEGVEQPVWRRENDIRSELERTKRELDDANGRILEVEQKYGDYESRMRIAETRYLNTLKNLQELEEQQLENIQNGQSTHYENTIPTSSAPSTQTSTPVSVPPVAEVTKEMNDLKLDSNSKRSETNNIDDNYLDELRKSDENSSAVHKALFTHLLEEYSDDTTIDVFVRDCAVATHRNAEKAHQWINKLQNQDIMTVGDLRDLHDEDWSGIGLTVFALRALKNMLKGKKLQPSIITNLNIEGGPNTNSTSPPDSANPSPY